LLRVALIFLVPLSLLSLSIVALMAMLIFLQKIETARIHAHTFQVSLPATDVVPLPSITVVIPAYNESINIADCIAAVLQGSDRTTPEFQVWVVDDQSTDDTLTIVQSIPDPRLKVFAGQSRPTDTNWVGKNWACAQVTEQIQTDYILFIDADVRLATGAIDQALAFAVAQQTDLLSSWVTVDCGCWGEWLCQPIIVSMFAAAFELPRINDPADPMIMAVGPFMLFRRSAYAKIGGHRAVATEVVEDVELARAIKQSGLKYWYGVGTTLGSLRMYRSLAGLWEGWTKNWYSGSRRNVIQTLYSAVAMFLIYALPSLVFLSSLLVLAFGGANGLTPIALGLSGLNLIGHYWLRRRMQPLSNIPPTYWWLSSLGGWIAAAIPIASLIKTETGWGWTWRGRSLKPTIPTN
jgi:glycosyltransferase involved in cell wall biosynthesis